MSNDEEKEEEEVRREHARLTWSRKRLRGIFFTHSRVSMRTRRAILDFLARETVAYWRERRGCGFRADFAHCLILGWFFLLDDDDANRDVF